jgi:hypothetical protein
MRQAIDFSRVHVCKHLERSAALYSYSRGDDVSPTAGAVGSVLFSTTTIRIAG